MLVENRSDTGYHNRHSALDLQVIVTRLELFSAILVAPMDMQHHVLQQLLSAHSMVPVISIREHSTASETLLESPLLALSCCVAQLPVSKDSTNSSARLQPQLARLQASVQLATDTALPRLMLLSACPPHMSQLRQWTAAYGCESTEQMTQPMAKPAGHSLPVMEMGIGLRKSSDHEQSGAYGAAIICSSIGNSWQHNMALLPLLDQFPDVIVLELPAGLDAQQISKLLSWVPQVSPAVQLVLFTAEATDAAVLSPDLAARRPFLVPAPKQMGEDPALGSPASATMQLLEAVDSLLFAQHCQSRTRRTATFQSICLGQLMPNMEDRGRIASAQQHAHEAVQACRVFQAAGLEDSACTAWLQTQHQELCNKQLSACCLRSTKEAASSLLVPKASHELLQEACVLAERTRLLAVPESLKAALRVLSIQDPAVRRATKLQLLHGAEVHGRYGPA